MKILNIINEAIATYSDAEAGQFIKAVCAYADGNRVSFADRAMAFKFRSAKAELDRMNRVKLAHREAGKKGGRKPIGFAQKNQLVPDSENQLVRKPNGLFSEQIQPISSSLDTMQVSNNEFVIENAKNQMVRGEKTNRLENQLVNFQELREKESKQEKEETPFPAIPSLTPEEKEINKEKESPDACAYTHTCEEAKPKARRKKPEYDLSFVDNFQMLPLFKQWLDYKNARNEYYKTPASLKTCYNNLVRWSNGNVVVAQEMLARAIGNNFMGFKSLRPYEIAELTKTESLKVNDKYDDINEFKYQ